VLRSSAAADGRCRWLASLLTWSKELRSSAAADGGRCLVIPSGPGSSGELRSSAAADGGRCRGYLADILSAVEVAILGRRGRRPLRGTPINATTLNEMVAILGRRGRRPLPHAHRVPQGDEHTVAILGRRGRRPLLMSIPRLG